MDTVDFSNEINAFVQAATAAADQMGPQTGLPLEYVDVESALMQVFGLDEAVELLNRHLTFSDIVAALSEFNFRGLFPEVVEEIILDGSLIPTETPQHIREVTVRSKGEVWRIHKNDADPWPSNPHAHNLETGLKLHLGTGELFHKRRNTGKKISNNNLEIIRSKVRNSKLPRLEV
jgi:hypothetical protein